MVEVNYLAILACGVVAVVIGFVWFGPLFGKQWMKLAGVDKATPEEMAEGMKKMPLHSFIQFVGALLMGFVLSHHMAFAASYLGTSGYELALMSGFFVWLGFVAPVSVGMVLWEGRAWKYWAIVSGNWLLTLCAMGLILAYWI